MVTIIGEINIMRIPFFDNKKFLVKFQSLIGGVREICLDSLLPFEAAKTAHPLNFARKYDLPVTGETTPHIVLGDRTVLNYYPLEEFKSRLAEVKAAVNLWCLIGEARLNDIRGFVRADRDYSIYVTNTYEGSFCHNDEYALLVAKTLLANKVSEGLEQFPTTNQLSFEKDKFVNQINPRSAMGFIWSIIRDDLVSGHNWHYRQCLYCGVWEDMSKPGLRRSIWTHCDKSECRKAHEREKNKARSRGYRRRRNAR
jgi:hypothetical protein